MWRTSFFSNRSNTSTTDSEVIYTGPVKGIQQYDLPSIYHHLHTGSRLQVRLEQSGSDELIAVYFRQFKLGVLPVAYSPVVEQLLHRGFSLTGSVTRIIREKYLPAESVEIRITDQIEHV